MLMKLALAALFAQQLLAPAAVVAVPDLTDPFSSLLLTVPHAACTTLFSRSSTGIAGSSSFGCSTPNKDEALVGALVPITTHSELESYVKTYTSTSSSTDSDSYHTAVLSGSMFTAANVQLLTTPPLRVRSFLLVDSSTSTESGGTSPAPSSPNGLNTPSSSLNPSLPLHDWNAENGDGMELLNLHGIPMSLVTDAPTASYIVSLARSNAVGNGSAEVRAAPMYAAAFNYYMGQKDMSSEKCLEWKDEEGRWSPQCLPLGGQSVWALSSPPPLPPLLLLIPFSLHSPRRRSTRRQQHLPRHFPLRKRRRVLNPFPPALRTCRRRFIVIRRLPHFQ